MIQSPIAGLTDVSLSNTVNNAIATMPSVAADRGAGMQSAARVPASALDAKHSDWTMFAETWEKLSLLYNAGPLLKGKASDFLWQRPKEIKDIFQARSAAFTYTNILGAGLTWYTAKLFAEDPSVDLKRNGKPLGGPAPTAKVDPDFDYYDRFQDDCDRNGTSLADCFREVFRQLLVYRRSYILLDLPLGVQDAATLGDQVIEPYLSLADPRFAYNWKTDAYGALEWILFGTQTIEQRFLDKPVTVYRWTYYDKQAYRVYERRTSDLQLANDAEPMATLVDEGPHSMADFKNPDGSRGRVPVVAAEVPEALWLAGRVFLQVMDHLNTENALRWGLFLGCLAQPYVKTDGEIDAKIAEHGLIQLRQGDEFGWAEPSGKSFEISAERLDKLREEIYRMMYLQAQGRSSSASASAQSGYSKEQDMTASKDVVNAFGKIMRALIQYTLVLVSGIRQDSISPDVRGLSFDDDPALNDLVAAQQVATLGVQSDTFAKELQKDIIRIYARDWNHDLMTKIFDEIDAAPTKSELEAQQQEMEQQQLEQKLASSASTLVSTAQRANAKGDE